MNIMAQAAIIFGVCLVSEGVAALIPVAFPASVIALLLLMLLLFTGALKPEHIRELSGFLVANMAFFFLPSCVGVMEHAPAILGQLALPAHQLSHHAAGLFRHRPDGPVSHPPRQRKGGGKTCLTPCCPPPSSG